jgi:hypothetical protein
VSASAANKLYDANASAAVTLSDDRIAGDVFTAGYTSAAFNNKNAGVAKPVAVSGIGISGADAGNYAANSTATASADITPLAITGSITASDRVYNGTTVATIATRMLTGALSGDAVSYTGGSANFADKNIGNGKTVSATGLGISGADAGNYTVNSTASATASITPLAITGLITAQDKVYDGTSAAMINGRSLNGAIVGDNVAYTGGTATFADKNVGTAKSVAATGLSLTGTDAGNYTVNTTANTTANITALGITGSIAAAHKVYDATTAASITGRTLGGVLGTDDVSYVGGAAAFSDKHVGTGKTVTGTGLSLSGADAGNYTVNTSATTTANITPRGLTVAAHGVDKVYDGTATATVTLTNDRLGTDAVTDGYASATFADKNVGTNKSISVTGISISGADAGNYTFNASASTAASITARPLAVSATASDKVYDATNTAVVSLSDNRVSGDVLTISKASATFANKHVGNAKTVTVTGISVGGTDAGNYAANTSTSTTASITPRQLVVSATGVNRIYDGTSNATVTLGDDRISGDVITPNYGTAAFADKNVGNGKSVSVGGIALSGSDAGDYSANTSATTTANITPRGLAVGATAQHKVYDGNANASATLSDDRVAGDALTTAFASATFPSKTVGNGLTVTVSGISVTGADAGNYTFNPTATATANITKLGITGAITANNKVYDGTTAATIATRTLLGVIAPDVVNYSGGSALFADKNVGVGKNISATGLGLTGTDAGNYSVNSAATSTADITARNLAVTAVGVNKVYDGTANATVMLSDNRVGGDVFTDSYASAAFADKNVGTNKTVSVSGITIAGTDAANYAPNTAATTSANVTAAPLGVTADNKSKVWDGAPFPTGSFTVTVTGFVPNETQSLVTGSAAFSGSAVGAVNSGTYPITAALGTLSAPNYAFTSFSGGTLTIIDQNAPVTTLAALNPIAISANPQSIAVAASVTDVGHGSSKIKTAALTLDGNPVGTPASPDFNVNPTAAVTWQIPGYSLPGVHVLCATGTDAADQVSAKDCVLLAIYDPTGSFVTGGGWINSPAGAYVANQALTGKANFGFESQYKKGANTPTGNTEFQFQIANLNFKSNSYEWLVVSGSKAQFKGDGKINGSGDYGFLLSAIDGDGKKSDTFRIKIWDKTTGQTVYDNQMSSVDTADPTTALGGGNVVIH